MGSRILPITTWIDRESSSFTERRMARFPRVSGLPNRIVGNPSRRRSFAKEYLFVSEDLTSFAFGDLNDDGSADLVRGSPGDGVFVHLRTKDDKWSEPVEIETKTLKAYSQAIKIMGKSGDSPARIFLFTEEGLEVLPFGKGRPLYPSKLFREDAKRANGLDFLDLDGDGRLDWLYSKPGTDRSLRIRHGVSDGFGPERSFDLALGSSFNPLPKGKRGKEPVRFCAIDRLSGESLVFFFSKDRKADAEGLSVRNFGVFPQDQKRTSWVYADFDEDGQKDAVTASSTKGEVLFLTGQESMGFSNPVAYPSLNGITRMSSVRLPSKAVGLLVLSPEENLVGLSHFKLEKGEFKGILTFPFPFP